MAFAHDIAGGQGNLIATQIQSPNFVHGVSGWRIAKDGSAEFQDVVLPEGSGGAVVTFAATAPTSPNVGDVWYNTSDGLEANQWNGTSWVPYLIGTGAIASGAITGSQINASVTARSLGGVTTTIAATAPSSPLEGDLWVNSTNGYQLEQYSGTAWVPISWTATDVLDAGSVGATLLSNAITARSLGGITTTIAATTPTSPTAGDIWINSSNGYQINQYSGTAWVAVQWTATDVIQAGTVNASLITAATITGSLIAAGTITAANIAANTITATQIAAGTITAAQIAAGTITAAQLAANTITAGNIAANTITAGQIEDASLTNACMATWAVDGVASTTSNGLNLIPDPLFSDSLIQTARTSDPSVLGAWTFPSNTAKVTQLASGGCKLPLLSSTLKPIWVVPGQTYYYSITVTRSGASTNGIGLQVVGNGGLYANFLTTAAGTTTISGTWTVPADWTNAYVILVTAADSGTIDNITFSNPVFQPASLFSPTLTGTDYTINPAGMFFYSGTPAAGNLVFSTAPAAGTDAFGNAYLAGVWAYSSTSGGAGLISVGGNAYLIIPPAGAAYANLPPQVSGFADNIGLANEYVGLQLYSGDQTSATGNAAIDLFSETNDATSGARGSLLITGTEVIGWNSTNMTVTTGGGILGNPDISQFDNTVDTNANLTGANPATKQWSIPANDAQVGTVYEIETPFSMTTWTTLETFGFKPSLNGTAVTTSGGDVIGATALAASTGYTGEVRLRLVIQTTGSSGTAKIFIKGGMALEGNLQGTVDAWFLSSQNTSVAFNTTVANTIAIDSIWGGNPSGSLQTVSNSGSVFTRKGP